MKILELGKLSGSVRDVRGNRKFLLAGGRAVLTWCTKLE
jgi:hypothetical protein